MLNIHAILKNVENQTVAGTNFEYLSNLKIKIHIRMLNASFEF